MFGFNSITIDPKGRIAMPAKYRDILFELNTNKIVVTQDPQYPALKIYPQGVWNDISSRLQSLQSLDPIVRKLQWTILGNASVQDFDAQSRMLLMIPSELRAHAEIEIKEKIALVGMGDKFELWSLTNWEARQHGGPLSTEILEVVLPETVKNMSF